MITYKAPLRDMRFLLNEVLDFPRHYASLPGGNDADVDTVNAILEGAAQLCEDVLAPLNASGDREGCHFDQGVVTTPEGFKEAYRQYQSGGWQSISFPVEYGGQGLPASLNLFKSEMIGTANWSFAMYPGLSVGCINTLLRYGTTAQKHQYLPKLVSGEWSGTMDLTEPQAGSDLAQLNTRAQPDGQGGYRISGQKIFITWGDHDCAENICHLLLARAPGSPPGVKGISLFLASKYEIAEDGSLGVRNGFQAASLEHKLGIHGSPTCVMLYEGAKAELVGELGQGLAHMFVMMNAARLQVGVQGVAIAERAFQQALEFSQERRQGKSTWSSEFPAQIYDHPDVRRTLMLMKAKTEAARAICLTTGVLADLARHAGGEAERTAAKERQELLTPIAKAWSTDVGVEVASMGIQVHGGMGYIEETGAAQHYRDARIAPIYEGTNGIQAIDLVGRKIRMAKGAVMGNLCTEMALGAELLSKTPELEVVGRRLSAGVAALQRATDWLLVNPGTSSLSGATPYLKLCGDVIGGWMLGRQALAAAGSNDPWLMGKAALARVFATQVLSGAPGLADSVTAGGVDLEATPAHALSA